MIARTPQATTENIPVALIDAHSQQPRIDFDAKKITRLSRSLADPGVGLIHPITVRRKGKRFELLSGERRLRAAKQAGWKEIDARILQADDAAALKILLIANVEAEPLNPLERAQAIAHLVAPRDEGGAGMTQEDVAKQLTWHPSSVCNVLRLLRLPDPWRSALAAGELSETKARLLVSYVDQPDILDAIRRDIEQNEWAWRTRIDWQRQIPLIAEKVICVAKDPTPHELAERQQAAERKLVERAALPLQGHAASKPRRAKRADVGPVEPLTRQQALELLAPYRGDADSLAAIRDAAAELLDVVRHQPSEVSSTA